MSNFSFLKEKWDKLAKLGDLAEKYVYSDANSSVIKQGMLAELLVKYMLAYDGIKEPERDNTNANRIRLLKINGLLPKQIDNTLYILRKDRNFASHEASDEIKVAKENLKLLFELCVWFMQTYGDYSFEAPAYVEPKNLSINISDLKKEKQELEARNKELINEIEQIQRSGKTDSARRQRAHNKANNLYLTEAQTRELIDKQLRKVGWEADTNEFRYSKGTRPVKNKNLAIAEWPTDSTTGKCGYAD